MRVLQKNGPKLHINIKTMKISYFISAILCYQHLLVIVSGQTYYPPLNDIVQRLKTDFTNNELYGKIPYNFDDPDCNRSALQLITSKGYPGVQYEIQTKDGYILGVQRILAGQNKVPNNNKKPAVLLQHGLGGCAANWLGNLENQSLSFILADAGYDVWLCNSRGNTYSTKHISFNTTEARYWQFSWDQMAKYDLPACVDYILNATGNTQLYYAGHSQGTMIGFAQFSADLEFAKKIKAFFALAPVAKVSHINSSIRKLAPYTEDLQVFFAKYGYYDFFPYNGYYHKYEYDVCSDETATDEILCRRLFSNSAGAKDKYYNQTRLPVYMSHCPAGTSVQNMAHYGQAVNTDTFQMFDYDFGDNGTLNYIHYGQPTPPQYNVSDLNVPTIVFHSDADALADPVDVAWLLSQINDTVVEDYHYTDYSHGDFIYAMNAADEIYVHIVDYIQAHENSSAKLSVVNFWVLFCICLLKMFIVL